MNRPILTPSHLEEFKHYLILEEKSAATQEKYLRDAKAFLDFCHGRAIDKELVLAYKKNLVDREYAVRSVNSMLASVNSLLSFLGRGDCRVKQIRTQQQTYSSAEKELTKAEYFRLLEAAMPNPRLYLVLQTICATGIRVSELSYFTVEAVDRGEVAVSCKNKTRLILIPCKLRRLLQAYAKKQGISSGPIFLTHSGIPIHRTSIWHEMKDLCAKAGVEPQKVFPHNLRKLFARTFYTSEKDIAKLADLLGHSNINTTRIYIMTTGAEHLRKIDRLGLVR